MCASHIIGNLLIYNGHRVLVCVVTREIVGQLTSLPFGDQIGNSVI